MAEKKKKEKKVRLVSTGLNSKGKPTGYFKTTTHTGEKKLELKKYDPQAWDAAQQKKGMKVLFKQEKIKKG